MARRIVIENECPHERTDECGNPICGECSGVWGHERECSYAGRGSQGTYPCPGGSRRVLDPGSYVLIEKVDGEWPLEDGLVTTRYKAFPHQSSTKSIHEYLDALAGAES